MTVKDEEWASRLLQEIDRRAGKVADLERARTRIDAKLGRERAALAEATDRYFLAGGPALVAAAAERKRG